MLQKLETLHQLMSCLATLYLLLFLRCAQKRLWLRSSSVTWATTLTPAATPGNTMERVWTWARRSARTTCSSTTPSSSSYDWTQTSSPPPSSSTSTMTSQRDDLWPHQGPLRSLRAAVNTQKTLEKMNAVLVISYRQAWLQFLKSISDFKIIIPSLILI